MIQFRGSSYSTSTSGTVPKHRIGNVILAHAYADGSATPPTLPAGYTLIGTGTNASNAELTCYKIAASTSETSGTFTGASSIVLEVYEGCTVGSTSSNGGNGNLINYPALSLSDTGGKSWVVGFLSAGKPDGFLLENGCPGSTKLRNALQGGSLKIHAVDTGTGVTSWSSTNVDYSIPQAIADWRTRMVELVEAPVGANPTFNFTLSESSVTSAGVYKASTGDLIRTLWNNVYLSSGAHTEVWDRYSDDGVLKTSAGGPYEIKLISNNVIYSWNGVLGNTSDQQTGSTVVRGARGIQEMCISGNNAYCPMGFEEGLPENIKLNLAVSMHSKTDILYPTSRSLDMEVRYVDTDDTYVYWGGIDTWDTARNGVFATKVVDDTEYLPSSGVSLPMITGRTYSKSYDGTTSDSTQRPYGVAVMKSGNYLFISKNEVDILRVMNKTTAAFVRDIAFTAPEVIKIDRSDNLWVLSGGTVKKYTINGDGTISSVVLTLSGFTNALTMGISWDGSTIAVIDGGSSQQIKAYDTTSGASVWTLGQAGGYQSVAAKADDKFMFEQDFRNESISNPFITFNSDGTFYVGDGGNWRVLKFNSSRVLQDTLQFIPMNYTISMDINNNERIFAGFLEFSRDRNASLSGTTGWTFVANWGGNAPTEYISPTNDLDTTVFKTCITLSNGKTYGTLNWRNPVGGARSPEYVELVSGGTLRFTGIRLPEFARHTILSNGDIIYLTADTDTIGTNDYWKRRVLTGFSGDDPVWAAATNYVKLPTVTATNPSYKNTATPCITTNGKMIAYATVPANQGYHLGGVRTTDTSYAWQTAASTEVNNWGSYPENGKYEIGNNASGGNQIPNVFTVENSIFKNYHGEFWRNSQTNKWDHFHDSGLMIGQFGTSIFIDAGNNRYFNQAAAGCAGNAYSIAGTKYGDDYYIYHNDEFDHSGVHEWQVSGLDTIQEQSTIIDADYTLDAINTNIVIGKPNATFTVEESIVSYTLDCIAKEVVLTKSDADITYDQSTTLNALTKNILINKPNANITYVGSSTVRNNQYFIFSFFGKRK